MIHTDIKHVESAENAVWVVFRLAGNMSSCRGALSLVPTVFHASLSADWKTAFFGEKEVNSFCDNYIVMVLVDVKSQSSF